MGLILTLSSDILASWIRLFLALILSILFSIVVGIAAATNKTLEKIILPTLDVLQTIPILGFFPLVILLVVSTIPGAIGVNAAVILLIFTSMVWNISFGVYEAVKAIPEELLEIAHMQRFTFWEKAKRIYIPSSLPRVSYQATISFSIGLFYLVASEIFSTGSKSFAVTYGIGVAISSLAATNAPILNYLIAILFLVIAVILTRILILEPFSLFSEKFSFTETSKNKNSLVLKFYSKIYLFLKEFWDSLTKNSQAGKKAVKKISLMEQSAKFVRKERHKRSNSHIYLTLLVLIGILVVVSYLNSNEFANEILVLTALAFSFVRVWFTYIICALIALPLGIKIGLSKKWFESLIAVLQVAASIPAPILLPLVIILLAKTPYFGELTAFVIILISMLWYLLFSVISGIRTIPESYFEVSSISKLSWKQRWQDIYIPAALPSFITGSITAIGGAWNALIVAEYFVVQSSICSPTAIACVSNAPGQYTSVLSQVGVGIGKLIDTAVFTGNITLMVLAIISMTAMVIIINRIFWQRIYSHVTQKYRIEG